jgi:hypothetical protein
MLDSFRWKVLCQAVDGLGGDLQSAFFIWYFKYCALTTADAASLDAAAGDSTSDSIGDSTAAIGVTSGSVSRRHMTDAEVGFFVGVVPLLGAIAQIGTTSLLAWAYAKYDVDARWPAVCSYVLCSVLGVTCFALSESIYAFMLYYCLYRMLYAPAIMWKTISFCMVIDEDSHR